MYFRQVEYHCIAAEPKNKKQCHPCLFKNTFCGVVNHSYIIKPDLSAFYLHLYHKLLLNIVYRFNMLKTGKPNPLASTGRNNISIHEVDVAARSFFTKCFF